MGLDVSKIIAAAKEFADNQGNRNGKIDAKEKSIFAGVLKKAGVNLDAVEKAYIDGLISKQEYNEVKMLLSEQARAEKYFAEGAAHNVFVQAENFMSSDVKTRILAAKEDKPLEESTRAELIKFLQEDKQFQSPEAKKVVEAFVAVNNKMEGLNKDTSVDDINAKVKELKKEFKDDANALKALDILKDFAVRERVAKVRADINERFEELKNAKAEELKDDPDKQSKLFPAVLDQLEKDAAKNDKDYEKVFKNMKQDLIDKHVEEEAKVIMSQVTETKKLKALSQAKALAKSHDKYVRKYFNDMTAERYEKIRVKTTDNKIEAKKVQTFDEMIKVVGKKDDTKALFSKLKEAGLIKELEDGRYDVSALSAVIGYMTGAENTLSRTSKDLKAISEKYGLKKEIMVQADFPNVDEKMAKKLAVMCGYDPDHLNWALIAGAGLIGGLTSALGAAIGAAASGPYAVREGDVINHNLTLELKNASASQISDIQNQYGGGANTTIEVAGNVVRVIIKQIVNNPEEILRATANFGPTILGAALGGVVPAVVGAILAENNKAEAPVIATDFTETCIQDYVKHLEAETDKEMAFVFTSLAAQFYDPNGDPQWDVQGYRDLLQVIKGGNSVLNMKELKAYLDNPDKYTDRLIALQKSHAKNCEEPEPAEKPAPAPKEAVVTKHTPEVEQEQLNPWDKTHIHVRKYGDGWPNLLQAYYPELEISDNPEEMLKDPRLFGPKGLIRKFQKALAYEEDGTFNKTKYESMVKTGNIPANIKIPSEFEGCKRVIRDVIPIDWAKHNKGKKAAKTDALKMVGHDEKGVDVSKVKVNGETVYVAKDKADPSKSAQGTTRDAAVAALEATQGEGFKYDKVTDKF